MLPFLLRPRRPPRSLWVGYSGALAFVAGVLFSQIFVEGGPRMGYAAGPTDVVMCFGFAAMLPVLCHERVNQILQPAAWPIRSLSAMSYSLYIFHYPVMVFLTFHYFPIAPDMAGFGPMLIKGCLIFIVCSVFYTLFERQTGAVRKRLDAMRKTALSSVDRA